MQHSHYLQHGHQQMVQWRVDLDQGGSMQFVYFLSPLYTQYVAKAAGTLIFNLHLSLQLQHNGLKLLFLLLTLLRVGNHLTLYPGQLSVPHRYKFFKIILQNIIESCIALLIISACARVTLYMQLSTCTMQAQKAWHG